MNGEEYTVDTFNKAFEDYTVEFLYNQPASADFGKNTGKVNTSVAKFKYAVEVSKDGEKVNTATAADFVEVLVESANKAVKVNEVGLVTSKAGTTKFPHSSVVKNEAAFIVATEFQNALGQTNKDEKENGDPLVSGLTAPAVKSAVSDQPTVAYYDVDNGITVLKDGKVTFTVEFDGIKEKSTITVDVKAKQELTSIQAADKKVANTDTGVDLGIKFFDQDGEEMHSAQTVYYTSTLAGENEGVATTTAPESFAKEGKYTVNVYKAADKKDKIGSLIIESVKVDADATITDYALVYPKDAEGNEVSELDVNPLLTGQDAKNELTITAEGLIEGVKVPLAKGKDLIAKSSNDKIVKVTNGDNIVNQANGEINLEAVAAGEATITLYTVEGELETPVATKTVTVKNSAPQVDTLTLKKDTKVDGKAEGQAALKEAVKNAVTEKIDTRQIKTVTPVAANGIVIVEFESEYGGKEFTLDAEFVDTELTNASAVLVKAANTDVTPATATAVDFSGLTLGDVITVTVDGDVKTFEVEAGFDIDALKAADLGVAITGDTLNDVTLTQEDGKNFTYKAVTPSAGDQEVISEVTTNNGIEEDNYVPVTPATATAVDFSGLTLGDVITVTVDGEVKTFEVEAGFDIDALKLADLGVEITGDALNDVTLTQEDGKNFTYKAVTPEAEVVAVATTNNGVVTDGQGSPVTPATATAVDFSGLTLGDVITVTVDGEVKTFEVEAGFDIDALKLADLGVEITGDALNDVTLTQEDGKNFTYKAVTPEAEVVAVATTNNGVVESGTPITPATATAVDFSGLTLGDVITVTVDGEVKTFEVEAGFDIDALKLADLGVEITGDALNDVTLTQEDGKNFTYKAVTPDNGDQDVVAEVTTANGVEFAKGAITDGELTLTFSTAVALETEGVDTITINNTIAGVAELSEDEKSVVITLASHEELPLTEVTITEIDGLVAANGSAIVVPKNDSAIKFTATVEDAPVEEDPAE